MEGNIGTNDVEKYAAIVSKQSVKKFRNTKLIMCAMRTKLSDAEYDERNTRNQFMRNSIEYARVTFRGSPADKEFKQMMKHEVEYVWNDGKVKNKRKVATLKARYAPKDVCEDIRDIVYNDKKLEMVAVTNATDVPLCGGMTVSSRKMH